MLEKKFQLVVSVVNFTVNGIYIAINLFYDYHSQNCAKNSKNYFYLRKTKFSQLIFSLDMLLYCHLISSKTDQNSKFLKPVFLNTVKKKFKIFWCHLNHKWEGINMIYLSTQSVGNLWFLILRGKQKAEKIKKKLKHPSTKTHANLNGWK